MNLPRRLAALETKCGQDPDSLNQIEADAEAFTARILRLVDTSPVGEIALEVRARMSPAQELAWSICNGSGLTIAGIMARRGLAVPGGCENAQGSAT